jgi:hypothetical protein
LKVVDKYKYLGIWFTYNLDWTEHINVTLAKADGKTANLRKLFSNKKVPARAKTLVWLSWNTVARCGKQTPNSWRSWNKYKRGRV